MKKQLEQFFGCEVKIEQYRDKLALPIFMTMRDIAMVEVYGIRFAVIDVAAETELSVAAMKKQKEKYEEALQLPIAYKLAIDSIAVRNALVKNGISFIDLPGNVFLPFAGIALQDVYKKQILKSDKMMPATQLVFLALLYMEDGESKLKSEIAKELNLTKTSITRATAQLEQMGLVLQSKTGTEIFVKRNYSRKEYYEKAKDYLINPVQKIISIATEEMPCDMWKTGETALSQFSELNPPVVPEYAIYKGEEVVDQFETVDKRIVDKSNFVNVQLWKYNPSYFAKDGCVDPVSLICTFKGNKDERLEICLEGLLEEL